MKQKAIKQFLTLAVVLAGFTLAGVSHATCIATGEISRISVNVGSSNFFVRGENPGSTSFLFNTTDPAITSSAVTAQASHMRVTVTGSAGACGPISLGQSAGGGVITLTTAP